MNINIKGTNLDLTPEIKEYVLKRINSLEKFFKGRDSDSINVLFEVAKKGGQKSGDIYHADCLIESMGEKFYASTDKSDIFEAVDEIKDILFREISRSKNKKWDVFYKGARKVKEIMKDASSYRPWKK
jgi:putative sigma-54 modulation protein